MAKVLNLDAMAPIRRTVTLGGQEYAVKEMTVEHFVEINQLANELDLTKDSTPVQQVEATVKAVSLALEGCPIEKIRRLTIDQLSTLALYVRGELDDEITAGNAQAPVTPETAPTP